MILHFFLHSDWLPWCANVMLKVFTSTAALIIHNYKSWLGPQMTIIIKNFTILDKFYGRLKFKSTWGEWVMIDLIFYSLLHGIGLVTSLFFSIDSLSFVWVVFRFSNVLLIIASSQPKLSLEAWLTLLSNSQKKHSLVHSLWAWGWAFSVLFSCVRLFLSETKIRLNFEIFLWLFQK